MKICVLAPYPSKKSYNGIFVAKLFDEIAALGNEIFFIAPQSISNCIIRKNSLNPSYHKYETKQNGSIKVYQPYIITFGNIPFLKKMNNFFLKRAVHKILKRLKNQPDVFYGHFWRNAYLLYTFIKGTNKPLYVATGESEFDFSKNDIIDFSNYIKGVICVSSKNRDESIKKGLTTFNKCKIFPNGTDNKIFYKKNKVECRKKFGYSSSDFIVVFVGSMIERKGALRLSEAIDLLEDNKIKVMFIGKIKQKPNCRGIIHCGPVLNNKLNDYLNCADVFVLPTLAEGCCNAIIEALFCALPIISSNLPFNFDILNKSNSIMINPLNINEIADAIKTLKENVDFRKKLAEGAEKTSKKLLLSARAKNIINYIKDNT